MTIDNPFEELKALPQSGSVNDYIKQFKLVSSQVPKLTESQYVGLFMGGLRSVVRQCFHTASYFTMDCDAARQRCGVGARVL